MSDSSLIPERQLVFSPGLAATIGLEEAILLQHLQELFAHHRPQVRNGFAWLRIDVDYLLGSLPFFGREDLHRVSRSLADKGVLLIESPPLLTADFLEFAVNEPAQDAVKTNRETPTHSSAELASVNNAGTTGTAQPSHDTQAAGTTGHGLQPGFTPRRSAGLLPIHWSPSEDLLQLLGMNHNIPRQFALDQLEDFIFYWRERGETSHAWENKFRQHVISNWRREQQNQAEAFEAPTTTVLDNRWRPSLDAMEIMERGGIARDFIEQAIPEFILYWRERGAAPKELNSKFIQHIRIQWAKYSSSLSHSTEPKRMTDEWQPAEDVFDILRLSHIDEAFARSLIPEFIVYWKDSNQVQTSWNSKFLQHAKYHWAKRHQMQNTDSSHGQQLGSGTAGRTRDRSIEQDLTDTSWAK